MSLRTLQGLHSPTFTPPPNAGEGLDILTLHDFHTQNSPNHPLFRYISGNDERIKTISWSEAVRAFCAASKFVKILVQSNVEHPVVSILASLDPITYFALVEGIMRAGFTPFPISTRNSDAAVAHLLKITESKHLFVSPDVAMQGLAAKALSTLAQEDGVVNGEVGKKQIDILPTPIFQDLFEANTLNLEPSGPADMESVAIIVHSSGSTSFPKPIRVSHRAFLERGRWPYYGEVDFCGEIMSLAGIPMFHGMGLYKMPEVALTGLTLAVFPPLNPPLTPTADNIFNTAVATNSTMIHTVPSILEEWAKDPEKVEALKSFKRVHVSGGPLVASVGDMLVGRGVNVTTIYASTELGTILEYKSQLLPQGWSYFSLGTMLASVLDPCPEDGENVYRLLVKKCKTHTPSVFNTTVDGEPAYDTSDLLIRHPINPNVYRIFGTAANQLMHSTGEKTNPRPIEEILMKDKKIAYAIMFGREKPQAGVLISPSPDFVFDPQDSEKLSTYRNMIWQVSFRSSQNICELTFCCTRETVLHATQNAPQHSKIVKELIVVVHPSKPLELTAKGTLRRQPSLIAYHGEIESAYEALEESPQRDIKPPTTWDLAGVKSFVSEVVNKSLGFKVNEDDSIFSMGADSLIATYIRNTITRGLRDGHALSPSIIKVLSPNFVYDNPCISSLTRFVLTIPSSISSVDDGDITEEQKKPDFEAEYQWPKMGQVGQTILQVRKGKGEPPLIIIHGVGGRVDGLVHFQEKFRSALWLVQATPDLPKESLRGIAAYYYHKVKELRPSGPYRFATYSGSHLLGFLIAEMMLNNGEEVTQLSLIDHTPSMMFNGLDQDAGFTLPRHFDITDKEIQELYKERLIYGFYELGVREDRTQNSKIFMDAWQGRPAPDHYVEQAKMSKLYMERTWDFVAQLPGYQNTDQQSEWNEWNQWRRMLFAVEEWLKGIRLKVPVTLYVATRGPLAGLKNSVERELWSDLGIRRCFPDAKVVQVEAGHATILWNEAVIKDLQGEYI
ncbi:hypothetical protein GYMLUDRAFT_247275 [Collybiopsis luxurians FD-317 M1]|uniref:AMP-dependent synthetase/ligase domain-containing protein n=1 Tax=Collybiopsis luxurians FD-317 M1 TaxID=944289 RepID=A0A0D0BPM8_9AGAR|nr:hypothetical protein GYMLUDRAFT_247275 [Collybiopsis luxurians FD-317 M1]